MATMENTTLQPNKRVTGNDTTPAVKRALVEWACVWVLDTEGRLMAVNPGVYRSIHTSLSSVLGQPLWETFWWNHDPALANQIKEAVVSAGAGGEVKLHQRIKLHDKVSLVDISVFPCVFETGNTDCILVMAELPNDVKSLNQTYQNLTAQTHCPQPALQAHNPLSMPDSVIFQHVLTGLPVGINITDAQGRIIFTNDAYQNIIEPADRSESVTKKLTLVQATRLKTGEPIKLPHQGGFQYKDEQPEGKAEEIEIAFSDGGKKTLLNYVSPIRNQNGHIIAGAMVDVDISAFYRIQMEQARLASIVESSNASIIGLSLDGIIETWNRGAEAVYGFSHSEIIGTPITQLVPAEALDEHTDLIKRVINDIKIERIETTRLTKAGNTICISLSLSPIKNSKGDIVGLSCIERDITQHKISEQEKARLAAIVETSYDAIISKDTDGVITHWNNGAERIYGYTAAEAIGKPVTLIVPPERVDEEHGLRAKVVGGASINAFDTVRRRKDGKRIHVSLSMSPVKNDSGRVIAVSAIERDITDRKRLEDQLRHDALHDKLTELPNRTLFVEHLQQAIARSKRYGENYAVLALDIDDFKAINDSFGHLTGDELLRRFAARIRKCLRPVDTLARFGGDEFIILIEQFAHVQAAVHVAERIQYTLARPFFIDNQEIHSGASIGIAPNRSDYTEPDEIIRDADAALYKAKELGKNRHVTFDTNMRNQFVSRLRRELELRKAIENGDMQVYYQPIVDMTNERIAGCEALVRWIHPEHGLLRPDEFIPIAEESGLILQLGDHVFNTVCQHLAQWKKQMILPPDFYVSVNLSAKQFFHTELTGTILDTLHYFGIQGKNIRLEITENMIMKRDDIALKTMQSLQDMNINLCIDDFGTGYSSLSYLHRFPLDVIKVDKSFVQSLPEQAKSREIVRAILGLAENLRMEAVAEGPETRTQLKQVTELGFNRVQGFMLYKPMPEDQIVQVLSRQAG